MSLIDNKTRKVWHNFMANKRAIKNSVGIELYSIQIYDNPNYHEIFEPQKEFTKWAAIEVETHEKIPIGFEPLTIEEGLYAVFLHEGPSSKFPETAQFIFNKWLPKSDYLVDDRPHFELLGANYKNNDPKSEEEVWIPIKRRT